jgi:hypothetical protein
MAKKGGGGFNYNFAVTKLTDDKLKDSLDFQDNEPAFFPGYHLRGNQLTPAKARVYHPITKRRLARV